MRMRRHYGTNTMNLQVKPSEDKIDHPSRNPNRKQAERRAKENLPKMMASFKTEGERKDYEKMVKANENNIMGLPTFYPPRQITSFGGIGEGMREIDLPCGHKAMQCKINYSENTMEYICSHNHKHNDNYNN